MAKSEPRPDRLIDVAALKPDTSNRRLHPTRNQTLLVESLQTVGAARSIVIDENDVIIAGNGVAEKAPEAGITKVQVIEADGDTLVAVRRRNLTPDQKRLLAMYDNRTAELAEWKPDQIAADHQAGLNLVPFFTDKELTSLLDAKELTETRKRLEVAKPYEVAWVIIALPLSEWPKHAAAVEAIQAAASFSSIAVREKGGVNSKGRGDPT